MSSQSHVKEMRVRKSKAERMKGNKPVTCPVCGWKGKAKKLDSHICIPKRE